MGKCEICGMPADGKVCAKCKRLDEIEAAKAAEVAEHQKMLREGLCGYCSEDGKCVVQKRFGNCESMTRCEGFKQKPQK
jgi:hypothetical protein